MIIQNKKLTKTIIVAIEGLSGTGKTTATNFIAQKLHGNPIYGDEYLFQFMQYSPVKIENIFGHPIDNMDPREYFMKYIQTPQQYSTLLLGAKEYVHQKFYWDTVNAIKRGLPSQVFDYSTISTMHPWVNLCPDVDVQRVLITADSQKAKKSILERERFDCSHIVEIFEETEKKLIAPSDANFVVQNNHNNIAEFQKDLREVCQTILSNAAQDPQ